MKLYLIAPKNPESFWTFDRILPSLKKRCIFPNLALPTVAGLTPPPHEVVLCDENVEPIDHGNLVTARVVARRDDLAVVMRIAWTCFLRASPRRAWLTLSMCLETAFRRPRAIRQAFTLALMHKHFYEYVRDTSLQLDTLIHELRQSEPARAVSGG
jgi:hypothetical protein